LEAEEI
jgi:hypothetical protein